MSGATRHTPLLRTSDRATNVPVLELWTLVYHPGTCLSLCYIASWEDYISEAVAWKRPSGYDP